MVRSIEHYIIRDNHSVRADVSTSSAPGAQSLSKTKATRKLSLRYLMKLLVERLAIPPNNYKADVKWLVIRMNGVMGYAVLNKPVKNGASGAGQLYCVVVLACLILGWSRTAFSAEPTAASDEQPHLQLAPIKLSHSLDGNIGYIFQRTTFGASKATQQSFGVGVNAGVGVQSFFWQPWLAQVSSNLLAGIISTSTNSSATPTYNTVSTAISGDAALDLVRYSRFPFQVRVFRRDNKYAAFYSGSNVSTQLAGYSLNQDYSSMNRRLVANASFTSSKSGGSNINPSYSNLFNFGLTAQPTQHQSISITASTDSEKQPDQGRSSLYDTLVANHAYQPNFIFSVASLANLLKINYSLAQGSITPQQFDANSLQFSSVASLRPEQSPLTMTGSVRFLRTDSSNNGILASTLKSSNFNLGANYLFSPLIRLYGSVNVADSLGTQTVSTDAALSAAKPYRITAATELGGFRYSGSIGGNLSTNNRTSTNSIGQSTNQNALNLGLYLSHALDKNSEWGAGRLSENLHQTVSGGVSSSGTAISNLNTGGSLSWNRIEGKENTQLRLSANDARNLRGPQSIFQMINLQASRSEAMSRNESLQGSLTVQATHTQVSGTQDIPNTITPSAEMNYRHQRAFKVLHLTFDSILRIADTNIASAQPTGSPNQATRSWDNNFDYKIGRLSLKLNTNMAKIGDTLQTSIMFMMNRSF